MGLGRREHAHTELVRESLQSALQPPSRQGALLLWMAFSPTMTSVTLGSLNAGDRVGRYRVERRLGQGGMGAVYLALDEDLERRIALKIVAPDASGDDATQRLLREARTVASLSHPNIVTVFDVGESDGQVWMAMEYVEGETLRARVGQVTDTAQALRWLVDVATALAAAHRGGLVHRDVKPDNIVLRTDDTIKVLDFGIARRVPGAIDAHAPTQGAGVSERVTAEGAWIGTPYYMAPEQIYGDEVDGRADQFAWGVLAYELLTGKLPWPDDRNVAKLLESMRSRQPPSLEGVPESVDRVVRRALAFDRMRRFDNFEEAVKALAPRRRESERPGPSVSESAFGEGSVVLCVRLLADASGGSDYVKTLLGAFTEELVDHVDGHGGAVQEVGEDGLLATFDGSDAGANIERAITASLEMRTSVEDLSTSVREAHDTTLAFGAGVAVATRDAKLTDARRQPEELAARGRGVLVAEGARGLAHEAFELTPVDAAVSRVERPASPRQPGPDSVTGGGLLGRTDELSTLARAVEEVRTGRGRIACVTGDPGVGKSRLIEELRDRHGTGLRWLEARAQRHSRTTSYGLIIELLRVLLDVADSDKPAIARAKLRAGMRRLMPDGNERNEQTVQQLLGLQRARRSNAAPAQALLAQVVVLVKAAIAGLPADEPTVLVFEDLNATDGASLDVVTALADVTDSHPVLIVVTARVQDESRFWDFLLHLQRNHRRRLIEVPLESLDDDTIERLMRTQLAGRPVPTWLRSRLLERAAGNPLFAEELVRVVLDQGLLDSDGHVPSGAGGWDAIPATVRGLVASRVDRLEPSVRAALQHASVLGRVFSRRELGLLSPDDDLDACLVQLVRADLIDERARLPEAVYAFGQPLTQEVAYAGLSAEARARLHRRAAEGIGAEPSRSAELAVHWEGAGDLGKALEARFEAMDRAPSSPEAVDHAWHAMALLDRLPLEQFGERHVDLVLRLMELPGWMRDRGARSEGLRQLERAIESARTQGRRSALSRLLSLKGSLLRDEALMEEALQSAKQSGDPLAEADNATRLGDYLGSQGRYEVATSRIDAAIDIYRREGRRYGEAMSMVVGGRCYSARAGTLDKSLSYAERARSIGDELDDPQLHAWRIMEAEPLMYQGRWNDVVEVSERWLPLAWKINARSPILFGSAWLALAYVRLSRLEDAQRVLDRAIAEAQARDASFPLVYLLIARAELHLARNQPGDARTNADAAVATAGTAYPMELGAAHRVLSKALAAAGDAEGARAAIAKSEQTLRDIQARPELAQTLLTKAELERASGNSSAGATFAEAEEIFTAIGASGWAHLARSTASAAD